MEMTDAEIMEAQKRLEERQASMMRMGQTPTGSDIKEEENVVCPDCGGPAKKSVFFGREWIECRPCRDAAEKERRAIQEEEYRQMKEADMIRSLRNAGIGHRFIGLTFNDYKPTNPEAAEVLRVCKEYAETFNEAEGRNILMIGACGTGKNMLSSIIGQEIMKSKKGSFKYTTAMRLVREIKDSWKDRDQAEQKVMDSFKWPSLLCIDEVGVQFGSPTEQIYLTEVINDRYEDKKPTILISNLTVPQLEGVMGVRVIDRFYEKGNHTLVFNWSSYRRQR